MMKLDRIHIRLLLRSLIQNRDRFLLFRVPNLETESGQRGASSNFGGGVRAHPNSSISRGAGQKWPRLSRWKIPNPRSMTHQWCQTGGLWSVPDPNSVVTGKGKREKLPSMLPPLHNQRNVDERDLEPEARVSPEDPMNSRHFTFAVCPRNLLFSAFGITKAL